MARNETNKGMLREAGAIEALVAMLSPERAAEEHVAALGAVCNLVEREESAADMLRLQGGLKRLRPLLATSDTLRPAHAARVLEHVASANQPTKVAMRVLDLLVPLVGLLSSQTRAARLSAAGALVHASRDEATNCTKLREAGAVAALMSLLEEEAAADGGGELEMQSRAAWCLANIAADPAAAAQLGTVRTGYTPLLHLLRSEKEQLQRPAAACLFNATISDGNAPASLLQVGALTVLISVAGQPGTNGDVAAWAAGAILNMAHRGSGGLLWDELPSDAGLLPVLLERLRPGEELQNANAAGALGNLCAHSEAARLHAVEADAVASLVALLDTSPVSGFAAGALASILVEEVGRQALVLASGVAPLVEILESEDRDTAAAAAVALLNATAHHPACELLLEAGGIPALLSCLSTATPSVRQPLSPSGPQACWPFHR